MNYNTLKDENINSDFNLATRLRIANHRFK